MFASWLRLLLSLLIMTDVLAAVGCDTSVEEGASQSDATSFIQGGSISSLQLRSDVIGSATRLAEPRQDGPSTLPSTARDVLVVFPGVGSLSRLHIVKRNIKILQSALGRNFKCFVRIYRQNAATHPQYKASLLAPCTVDYNKLQLFASVKAIDVPAYEVSRVLFLNDDMTLGDDTLVMLSSLLSKTDVDVASASYHESWCASMHPRTGLVAHESHFVEFNAVLFKTAAFRCLQNIVDPVLNPLGYGYDNMFAATCGVRMAVCDACPVGHVGGYGAKKGGSGSKVTYDHGLAMKQMQKWFASLKNTTGFDSCDPTYPSTQFHLTKKDLMD